MVYRYVPARWRLFLQLATLVTTALLGLSLLMTPPNPDPTLTHFEQVMGGPVPAWCLIVFGVVGAIGEYSMDRWRETNVLYGVVTSCHCVLFGTYMALSASALVTTLRTEHWYTFGGPALGVLLALWHLMYVQRRREIPIEVARF